jgi:hypothetical protein
MLGILEPMPRMNRVLRIFSATLVVTVFLLGCSTDSGVQRPEQNTVVVEEPIASPITVSALLPTAVSTRLPIESSTPVPANVPATPPVDPPTAVATAIPTPLPMEPPTTGPTEVPAPLPTESSMVLPTEVPTEVPNRSANGSAYSRTGDASD